MNAVLLTLALVGQVDFPIGHLHNSADIPRFQLQSFSEGNGPYVYFDGTSLSIREPDGSERLLVEGKQGTLLAVHDWNPSLDAQFIVYAHIFRHTDGKVYCDLFKKPTSGGDMVRLTDAVNEWNGVKGVYPAGFTMPVWNVSPCVTPEGIIFCSDRDGIKSPGEVFRAHQLYRIDNDGHTHRIDFMNLGGALHPVYHDGWVYFSTAQQQGLRGRNGSGWAIWRFKPDGTSFEPVVSEIPSRGSTGSHFVTVTSDGHIVFGRYYDTRDDGMLLAAPLSVTQGPFDPPTPFGDPVYTKNPPVWAGWDLEDGRLREGNNSRYGFQRRGLFSPFPWAHAQDRLNTNRASGTPDFWQGEIGRPAATPGNKILATATVDWKTGKRHHRIVMSKYALAQEWPARNDALPSDDPRDYLEVLTPDPTRNFWDAKAVVRYSDIYGSDPPPTPQSPKMEEFGVYTRVGSTSVDMPEIVTPDGKQRITVDWNEVIDITIYGFVPTLAGLEVSPVSINQTPVGTTSQTRNRQGFSSAANELMGILGTIPLRKWRTPDGKMYKGRNPPPGSTPIMREDNPQRWDTSFAADILADNPYTFGLNMADGRTVFGTLAQTWRQGRPMEIRTNCQGCHNHNEPDRLRWQDCPAASPDYEVLKFDKLRFVEYHRDIKPIDDELGLGLGPRPFYTLPADVRPKAFQSAKWELLNDPRIQARPDYLRKLAEWCDTAFPANTVYNDGTPITFGSGQGVDADAMPPTLVMRATANGVQVAAGDQGKGVNWESLSVVSSVRGQLTGGTRDGDVVTFAGRPATGEMLTATIRDNQIAYGPTGQQVSEAGNVARVTITVGELPPPPNPNQPEIDALLAEEAALLEQRDGIDARLEEIQQRLEELERATVPE